MTSRRTCGGSRGWRVPRALGFGLLAFAMSCGSSGQSGTAACAPAAAPSTATFAGAPLPPGATLFGEDYAVGHEGAEHGRAWAACPCSPAEVATWLDHGDRGLNRQTTAGAPSWTNEEGVTIAVFADRELAGAPEDGAPAGAQAWLSLRWQGEPAPCPPCPPDFEGTLVPGCGCP